VFGEINGYVPVLTALAFKESQMWPATPESVGAWLGWLHQFGVKSGAKYLSGLRDAHIDRGLPFFATSVEQAKLARLRTGAALLAETLPSDKTPQKTPFPITATLLRRFCRDPRLSQSQDGRLFLAATSIAVYAGSRGGEIFESLSENEDRVSSNLQFESLQFDDPAQGEGMTIVFPPTKTNKLKAVSVWLPLIPDDATCPVSLLREYLAGRDTPRVSEPLLARADSAPLAKSTFIKWTASALRLLGVEIPSGQQLSSKSWRAGAAQSASALPADIDDRVKAAGRWRSSAFKHYLHGKAAHRVIAMAHAARLQLERADRQSKQSTSSNVHVSQTELSSWPAAAPAVAEPAPSPASPSEASQPEDLEEQRASRAVEQAELESRANEARSLAGKRVRTPRRRLDSGLTW
jgi:hypothetical protein